MLDKEVLQHCIQEQEMSLIELIQDPPSKIIITSTILTKRRDLHYQVELDPIFKNGEEVALDFPVKRGCFYLPENYHGTKTIKLGKHPDSIFECFRKDHRYGLIHHAALLVGESTVISFGPTYPKRDSFPKYSFYIGPASQDGKLLLDRIR